MSNYKKVMALVLLLAFVLSACGVSSQTATEQPVEEPASEEPAEVPTEEIVEEAPSEMEGIAGSYDLVGTNPDGSEYGCSLQVTKTADGVYEWYWFSCGEYTGVGIQDGNVISVAYGSENCSAISYHVEDDGVLNGSWTYVGMTDLGTDVASPK